RQPEARDARRLSGGASKAPCRRHAAAGAEVRSLRRRALSRETDRSHQSCVRAPGFRRRAGERIHGCAGCELMSEPNNLDEAGWKAKLAAGARELTVALDATQLDKLWRLGLMLRERN